MTAECKKMLAELFAGQRLAVLATGQQGEPYASLVAFAAADDLRMRLFVTARETRKFQSLAADPRAALLIDNRSNAESDFEEAIAVTALGRASELSGPDVARLLPVFLERHPGLADFASQSTTVLCGVAVERYLVVDHFQRVTEIRPA